MCICYFGVTNLWPWIKISKYSKQYKTLYMMWKIQIIIIILKLESAFIFVYFFKRRLYEISHTECKYFCMAIQLIYMYTCTMSVTGRGLYLSFRTCVQSFWIMSIKYVQFNSHIKSCKDPFTPEVVRSYNIMHVKMVVNVKFCIGRGRSKF